MDQRDPLGEGARPRPRGPEPRQPYFFFFAAFFDVAFFFGRLYRGEMWSLPRCLRQLDVFSPLRLYPHPHSAMVMPPF